MICRSTFPVRPVDGFLMVSTQGPPTCRPLPHNTPDNGQIPDGPKAKAWLRTANGRRVSGERLSRRPAADHSSQ